MKFRRNKKDFFEFENDRKTHVKLYKAGKQWVSSLISSIGLIRVFKGKLDKSTMNTQLVSKEKDKKSEDKLSSDGLTAALKGAAVLGAVAGGTVLTANTALADTKQLDSNQNLNSVNKYGGFYIARFEAGDGKATSARTSSSSDDTNTLVSQKGAFVYNFVTSDTAKKLSSEMYKANTSITSQLITGSGWDRTLDWIIETAGKTEEEVLVNSSGWGNYINSTGNASTNSGTENINYTTGRNEYWKSNNIYDLAGNTNEWTQEQITYNTYRGGDFHVGGNLYPAKFRDTSITQTVPNNILSFRIEIYINV